MTLGLTPVAVLSGKPSVRDIEGFVREDGSVVRATVPPHPMVEEPVEAMD
jgi:alpha,alpha-trehalose phosphorylase